MYNVIKQLFNKFRQRQDLRHYASIFQKIYQYQDSMQISLDERERLKITDPAFTYGEVSFSAIAFMLEHIEAQAHETFYDLGSGAGKTLIATALMSDINTLVGIEKLPKLVTLSQQNQQRLLELLGNDVKLSYKKPSIKFIEADILDVDISNADIVFINATCFDRTVWDKLTEKFQQLKPGSRIITTTKQLPDEYFESMIQSSVLMSWGYNSIFIYRKIL